MNPGIRHGTYYGFLQHKLRRALGLPGGQPCAACLRKAAATVTFLPVAAHREEFASYLSGLDETVSLAERRSARKAQRSRAGGPR